MELGHHSERRDAGQENEPHPQVILHFFRHGEKDKGTFNAPDAVPISPKGRIQSEEKGKELHPNPAHAFAYGSPRVRAQETAIRTLLAEHGVTAETEPENIDALLKEQVPFGKKLVVDERLNFHYEGAIESGVMQAIQDGEYISFIIDKSDGIEIERRKQQEPKPATSFSIMAGNIAELVQKYGRVAAPVRRLVVGQKIAADHIERYLGSHGGVLESFCAKLLQIKQADAELAAFLDTYKNGFSELQGITVSVSTDGKEPTYTLTFTAPEKEFHISFTNQELKKMITDKLTVESYGK